MLTQRYRIGINLVFIIDKQSKVVAGYTYGDRQWLLKLY